MKIAILKERRASESRVAASPETVKKLAALGCEVAVEKGAGAGDGFDVDKLARRQTKALKAAGLPKPV